MSLTGNQLIQINATIIAGLLILLGIMTQQSRDILFNMSEGNALFLEFSLLTQIIIKILVIPFALSATIEIIHSLKRNEQENATKSAVVISALGFISVVGYFVLEIVGGLILLYS